MNLFVFGLGYSARHFVTAHRERFARVVGTVTALERSETLAAEGVAARLFDGEAADPRIAADLADSDALLVSVPPGPAGDPVLTHFAEAIAAAERLRWIGCLSTLGVYGDHGGAWIDETAKTAPANARSRERLAAETAWLDLGERAGKPVQIFRLAGIYGPGRNALVQIANGTARRIVKPGQVFNRIHVADIAAVLAAALARPRAGPVFNVADDEPAPASDVIAFAAALAGVAPPPEIPYDEAALTTMAASFYAECKRAANRRIKDELGVRLAYPTYREGLTALRAAGEGPDQAACRLAVGPKWSM